MICVLPEVGSVIATAPPYVPYFASQPEYSCPSGPSTTPAIVGAEEVRRPRAVLRRDGPKLELFTGREHEVILPAHAEELAARCNGERTAARELLIACQMQFHFARFVPPDRIPLAQHQHI